MKRALYGVPALAFLYAGWLSYTGKLERNELLVGIPAVILAAFAAEIVRDEEHPRFFPNARMWLPVWRVPAGILRDALLIAWKLLAAASALRKPTGKFLAMRFNAGGADSHSVARRALAVEFSTMPPNSIIVGIDRRRNLLLFHQLVGANIPRTAYFLRGKQGR